MNDNQSNGSKPDLRAIMIGLLILVLAAVALYYAYRFATSFIQSTDNTSVKGIITRLLTTDTPSSSPEATPEVSITTQPSVTDPAKALTSCEKYSDQYVSFTCPKNGKAYVEHKLYDSTGSVIAEGVVSIELATDDYTVKIAKHEGNFGYITYDYKDPSYIIETDQSGGDQVINLSSKPQIYSLHNGTTALLLNLNGRQQFLMSYKHAASPDDSSTYYPNIPGFTIVNNKDFKLLSWNGTTGSADNINYSLEITFKKDVTKELTDRVVSDLNHFFDTYLIY